MNDYKINITFPSGKTIQANQGVRACDFLEELGAPRDEIFAVRVNNEICSLNRALIVDSVLEGVLKSDKDGSEVYRRTLCFVLAAALHNIASEKHLVIGHSLGYGYYYTLQNGEEISDELIVALKNELASLVEKNLPIETHFISYDRAVKTFESLGLTETRKGMNYKCPTRIQMNTIVVNEGTTDEQRIFTDLYYGPLLVSTGMLKVFDLVKYRKGFLLRFPMSAKPDEISEFHDVPVLSEIYERYKNWGKQVGVVTVASLSELVSKRKANDFINITEVFQQRCISEIATQIQSRGKVRLVLIAGPSSSGKTTSAKKLALELEAIGYRPKVISLDNYYVGRESNPKDENGNYDYECLEALDIELINNNLVDLLDGKVVDIPSYNFTLGTREYKGKTMQLGESDILIMEGIHGLNDRLTPLVKSEYKFKLYLSALTQLNMSEHNRISTSDNRLIRRIVRDNNFRGKSAAETISMWDSVRRGERLHIFPFQNNADAILNTALDYELSVLKIYAEPLLRCITPSQREYSEACRLLRFLDAFPLIPAEAVPTRSIIREFIGGSAFKY